MTCTRPLLCLTVFLALAAPARAGDMVTLDLLPGWRAADGTHVAGLSIRLAPGWKTYWRSPGDAGIPPQIDWAGSENLGAAAIRWPTPVAFDINGMTSVGYDRDVVLPLVLTPDQSGAPMQLRAHVTLGVCKTICVPVDVQVRAELPGHVAATDTPARDQRLVAALADLPQDRSDARVTCSIAPTRSGLRLQAEVAMPPVGAGEYSVVETADPEIWVAEAATRREGNILKITAEMEHVAGEALALDRSGVRLTVLAAGQAVEIKGCD